MSKIIMFISELCSRSLACKATIKVSRDKHVSDCVNMYKFTPLKEEEHFNDAAQGGNTGMKTFKKTTNSDTKFIISGGRVYSQNLLLSIFVITSCSA